ncbi:uncharacterized protein LOC133173705 isoform X4 [Saccostrea echinata]|uniref:uncharacterized protein LOC133173705 isoform X4 n=1 Tax=Saccostrea echinata TaxID=191078 RepID=UPI002A7FD43F|nr:uncharacterized protein LOC133173705 isoform X4 [Saccostrea echinata]
MVSVASCLLLMHFLGFGVKRDDGSLLWILIASLSFWWCPITKGIVKAEGVTVKFVDAGSKEVLECFMKSNTSHATLIRWVKYSDNSFTKILVFQQMQHYPEFIREGYRGRVRLVNQSSLELSNIKSSDEGLYECSLTYTDGGGEDLTHVHLKVKAKPYITSSSPTQLHQLLGATVNLFCRAKGTPPPEVVWSKNGIPLVNSKRVTIALDKESVEIRDVQRSDGGIYTCTFTNSMGAVSQRIDLIVEGAAYILNAPSNRTTLEGQKIQFSCGAAAFPNNITYRWYFKSRNVLTYNDSRLSVYPDGKLVISPVYKKDMGWYTCRPSNGVGEDPEASAFLNVTYAPKILVDLMPAQVTWALGYEENLDCPVDANPPVREFSWKKNTYLVSFSSDHITLLPNGSLLVKSVQHSDAGAYSCMPVSSIGNGPSSPLVQVIVQDPPKFIFRPEPQYLRIPGQDVTMICGATGKPTPEIQWRKVTGVLDLSKSGHVKLEGGNLTIRSLEKEDHGRYECQAENEVKTIVVGTDLIIQMTTPHAPYNVTVIPDWFSARISWIPAYNGGNDQFFMIWYRSVNGQVAQWSTMQVIPKSATVFTVYGLTPDTLYEFKVLSRNNLGSGNFSEIVQAKTKGNTTKTTPRSPGDEAKLPTALPTDSSGRTYYPIINKSIGARPPPPRNVTARIEDSIIRILWLPPHTNMTLYYYIAERSTDGQKWESFDERIKVPYTFFIWRDALPNVEYYFRVYSYSLTAYSVPSEVVRIRTPPAEKSDFFLSQAEIGGIVGALLFLLITVLLAVVGIICNKRRQKPDKFGNVKYIGPADELDTRPHYRGFPLLMRPQEGQESENTSEWSGRGSPPPSSSGGGGANSLRRIPIANGIYILPDTQEIHRDQDMIAQEYMAESQLYDPHQYMYNSDKGYLLPNSAGHDPGDWEGLDGDLNRSKLDSRNTSHSVWKNPAKGKYPLYSGYYSDYDSSFQSPTFEGDDHTYVNVPSPHSSEQQVPDTSFQSHPHSSGYHGSYVDDDDENGFVPKRPPLPKEYQRIASGRSISMYDPLYENVNSSFADDVFLPPTQDFPGRHSLPRHSSMKPSYQTYLTGDPTEDDGGFTQPFGAEDISSVMPSFNESFSGTRDRFAYPPYKDTNSRTLLEQPNWSGAEVNNYPLSTSERYSRPKRRESDIRFRSRSSDHAYDDTRHSFLSDSYDYPDDTTVRHISPSKRSPKNDFSFGPSQYTRDQLQGAVEKIRKGPRARRSKSAGRLPSQEANFPYSYSPQVVPNLSFTPMTGAGYSQYDDHPRQRYSHEIAPFKGERGSRSSVNSSGRGSLGARHRYPTEPRSYAPDDLTPDSLSSGRGSRNTSQATGSSKHSHIPRNSLSSYASPQEHDLSQDSSPFLDATGSLQKDTSADDNYEFDSLQALEADLINTLRSYPLANQSEDLRMAIESGLNTSDFYDNLYPKPRVESQYDDSEARFEKLRQEFHQFRRKQQEISQQTRLAMDSDML